MRVPPRSRQGRRSFVSNLVQGVTALGVVGSANAESIVRDLGHQLATNDSWFDFLTGKHKMVFDVTAVNEGYAVIWPFTYLQTNNATGTPDEDLNALVVFRSKSVPLALSDKVWAKHKLGKLFKVVDYKTNAGAERNPYWNPSSGEMPEEGMSIKALQERGCRFCVCETAISMTSKQIARSKGQDPGGVKNDFIAGLIPGIPLVPSGVWAIDRAQERGCSYCAVG